MNSKRLCDATDVLAEIDNPYSRFLNGICWADSEMWAISGDDGFEPPGGYELARLNPATGEKVETYNTGFSANGLTWDGNNFWAIDDESVVEFDSDSGEIENRIPAPVEDARGVSWDGEMLWVNKDQDSKIVRISPDNGEIDMSVSTGFVGTHHGSDWYEGFLWRAGGSSGNHRGQVEQIDPNVIDGDQRENYVLGRRDGGTYGSTIPIGWDDRTLWIGGWDSIRRFELGDIGEPVQPPNAEFEYSPESPGVNQEITFDGGKSSDPVGFIDEYRWDFTGDGATDSMEEQVNWSFSESGEKEVTLVVVNDQNAADHVTKTIEVSEEAEEEDDDEVVDEEEDVVGDDVETEESGSADEDDDDDDEEIQEDDDDDDEEIQEDDDEVEDRDQEAPQRGFFTNNGDDFGLVDEALSLTIVGFVLSVVGIVYQMIKGR